MSESGPEYRIQRSGPRANAAPTLDPSQQRVVEHMASVGGPLQVLAGPGAGKTTTLVEVVVDRIAGGGLDPEQVLVLTFSRQAAAELRARIARRLQRTTATTAAMTFHSFCYALLRAEQDSDSFADPLRLLSAPEQDAAIAEVLANQPAEAWPVDLRPALRTRGMATELQRLLASARARNLDAVNLVELGEGFGRDDWAAAGRFFDELTGIAALANTIDHADMIFQAVRLLQDPHVRDRWRRRLRLVVVDEYQDTDPLQVELLQALAGEGRDLMVVGDPYQSIYGFRGADVRGIVEFPEMFCAADGSPATRLVLQRTNRYGERIADAVRSVIDNKSALASVDTADFARLRTPQTSCSDPGRVDVRLFTSPAAEAEAISLALREQHLHHERPWNQMAVLVRSSAHLIRVQRALEASGVPVQVAGDEVPLALEPAVRTLLSALHVADALHRGETIDLAAAEALLTGPLGGLDAGGLRRLGRELRRHDHDQWPRPSRVLIAEALGDPNLLATLQQSGPTGTAIAAARAVAALLAAAAEQIGVGASAEEVLWTLWDSTTWPRRLRTEAESDGDAAARANHDLDALCALFAEAARAEEKQAHRDVRAVVAALEAQQIPADTLAQEADGGSVVHLMTAHRSKGLEWPFVVVAGVQDGQWPDARLRSSLLQHDRLSVDQVLPLPTMRTAIAEERRLFYVACTRASSQLVVTAVQATADEGDQPSRFVLELRDHLGQDDRGAESRPVRALSLRSAVARLRALGEASDDPAVQQRAAQLLARVAAHPMGRSAHPERWWGLAERTTNEIPVRDPQQPLRLSGSQISGLEACPLQWFLDHEVRGGRGTSQAQGFGSIVHALAADVVRNDLPADADRMAAHLRDVWDQLDYAPWIGRREQVAAHEALTRFATWHRNNPRTVVAAEHEFDIEFDVDSDSGPRSVRIKGSMDRVEVDADGGIHVIDLKTSKNPPSNASIAEHAQLGAYQLAVMHGAVPQVAQGFAAGAELVQLRQDDKSAPGHPKVQPQDRPPADEPFFALDQLRRSVRHIDTERFVAIADEGGACQWCDFTAICPSQGAGATIIDQTRGAEES